MKKLIKYIKSLHFHKWEDTENWGYDCQTQICTVCKKLRTVYRLD